MTHSRDHEPEPRAETSASSLPAGAPVPPEPLTPSAAKSQPTTSEFVAAAATPEYGRLRRAFRSFAFPMTVVFLVWYLAYVLGSIFAKDLMMTSVFGNVTVGFLFGIGQFVSTFLITWLYIRHSNRKVDPLAKQLREQLEGLTVELPARASGEGKLFGAVSAADVAAAIKKAGGPAVDRRAVIIGKPIKATGSHTVGVKLTDAVTAHLPVVVVAA